jgi:hypothetical protein
VLEGEQKKAKINFKINFKFLLSVKVAAEAHEAIKRQTYKFLLEARHVVIIPDVLPSSVPLGLFSSHEMIRELRPLCKLCCSDDCL